MGIKEDIKRMKKTLKHSEKKVLYGVIIIVVALFILLKVIFTLK
jgi:hypothetical protein